MGLKTFLGIGVVLLALTVGTIRATWAQTPAPEPPLFVAGQRYLVIYHGNCVPDWMPRVAEGVLRIPQQLNPCFGETVEVTQVRRDGWLVGRVAGEPWMIQVSSIAAFQAEPVTQRATIMEDPGSFSSTDLTAQGALGGRTSR